jgi:hypothetical protein
MKNLITSLRQSMEQRLMNLVQMETFRMVDTLVRNLETDKIFTLKDVIGELLVNATRNF